MKNILTIQKARDSRKNYKPSELTKQKTKETMIKTLKENPNIMEKHSEYMKDLWKDDDFSKKQISLILNGLIKRPTSYEKMISYICIENNLPFIYTGNGTFLIGHKNPDFVNKENKIAIEVYHNYFKIREFGSCEEYEKKRGEYFAKYGWNVIFIRTEDMERKDWEDVCLNKINCNNI
jgi:very-short-patch-repair endonuclease